MEVKKLVLFLIEMPPDIISEINGSGKFRANGTQGRPAHTHFGEPKFSEDKKVIENDIDDDHNDGRGNESASLAQAGEQSAEGKGSAGKRNTICIDLQVTIQGIAYRVGFHDPVRHQGRH